MVRNNGGEIRDEIIRLLCESLAVTVEDEPMPLERCDDGEANSASTEDCEGSGGESVDCGDGCTEDDGIGCEKEKDEEGTSDDGEAASGEQQDCECAEDGVGEDDCDGCFEDVPCTEGESSDEGRGEAPDVSADEAPDENSNENTDENAEESPCDEKEAEDDGKDCEESEADDDDGDIDIEFYGINVRRLEPSQELLFDYCDRRCDDNTRKLTERLLECPWGLSEDEVRVLSVSYGMSAGGCSRLLALCGFEPLRPKTLCDTVFCSGLGDSKRAGEDRCSALEYINELVGRYEEASTLLEPLEDNGEDDSLVLAPSRNGLGLLCGDNLADYVREYTRYFIERRTAILEKYSMLMTVLLELYDNTAINCSWTEAEGKYCLRSFIERFCCELPARNSYSEYVVKKIEKGFVPTRELMILLFIYELSLCGMDGIIYKGKGKGSKKVTRDLAAAIEEWDGVSVLHPGIYFENEGCPEITSVEQLIYRINLRLCALGYQQLCGSIRFDSVLLSLIGLSVKTRNGGKVLVIKRPDSDGKERSVSIDISETADTVPPLLTAIYHALCEISPEGRPLGCKLCEEF